MIEKTEDLRRTQCEIDHLMHMARPGSTDLTRAEVDLLERGRQSIVMLLEARRTQNHEKVVSLQSWRNGTLIAPQFIAEHYAAMAQTNRPQPGAPRPILVVSRRTGRNR